MVPSICRSCIHYKPDTIFAYGYSASEERYGKIIPCDAIFVWLHEKKSCDFYLSEQVSLFDFDEKEV